VFQPCTPSFFYFPIPKLPPRPPPSFESHNPVSGLALFLHYRRIMPCLCLVTLGSASIWRHCCPSFFFFNVPPPPSFFRRLVKLLSHCVLIDHSFDRTNLDPCDPFSLNPDEGDLFPSSSNTAVIPLSPSWRASSFQLTALDLLFALLINRGTGDPFPRFHCPPPSNGARNSCCPPLTTTPLLPFPRTPRLPVVAAVPPPPPRSLQPVFFGRFDYFPSGFRAARVFCFCPFHL